MSLLFDVASVLMVAIGCGYLLLAGLAYHSYKNSGSKFLLFFMGAFTILFFMNLYGGVAGAYHPYNGLIADYLSAFGFTYSAILTNLTAKNLVVFEVIGLLAFFSFIIGLYKA
ncbi:MAG: hypothetical protein Q6366_013055 [Candidatus Freyarchaeota archaeon]